MGCLVVYGHPWGHVVFQFGCVVIYPAPLAQINDTFFAINHIYCIFCIIGMSVPENVVEYIEKMGDVDADQMSKDLQISVGSARNYLSRLKSSNRVTRIGKGTYRVKEL